MFTTIPRARIGPSSVSAVIQRGTFTAGLTIISRRNRAFRLAETEAVLRAEAAAAGRSRLRARSRIAAWTAREFWIGVLLASLAGYAALGAYLLIVLPGRLLGVW